MLQNIDDFSSDYTAVTFGKTNIVYLSYQNILDVKTNALSRKDKHVAEFLKNVPLLEKVEPEDLN